MPHPNRFGFRVGKTFRAAGAAAAPPSRIYWGAHIGGAQYGATDWPANASSAYNSFVGEVGKSLALGQYGGPWATADGLSVRTFPTTQMNRMRTAGAIPVLTWFPGAGGSTTQPNFTLDKVRDGTSEIISGTTFQSYIDQYATDAQSWGHPFWLRLMHEMNGNWYPFSEGVNSNGAGDFVATWRYIHGRFTAICPNATFVWCPNVVTASGASAISTLYPGDSYVDWVGLDGYNLGSPWRSFDTLFSRDERGDLLGDCFTKITGTIAPSKPFGIFETGCVDGTSGQKATWLSDTLDTQLPGKYAAVKLFSYYNYSDYPDGTNPVNIENDTPDGSAVTAFNDGIAATRYAGNEFGSLAFTKIAAL